MDKSRKKAWQTSAAKVRELRQNILAEIVLADPGKTWSSRKMAEAAKQHPWFQEHMPKYGHMTAYRDFLAVMEQTEERRKELAEGYLNHQLNTLDDMLENVVSDLDTVGSLEELIEMDDEVTIDSVTKFVTAKAKLASTALRIMERQSTLVPIEITKKLEIENTLTIDTFLTMRKQIQAKEKIAGQLSDGIVEGEYTEEG